MGTIFWDRSIEEFNKLSIKELISLKEIVLDNQGLKVFPKKLFSCKNLEILYLRKNKISAIPSAIENLQKLKSLYLSDNSLHNTPSNIAKITSLENIDISGNLLQEFPKELLLCSNLTFLDLSKNKISTIPSAIENLQQLELFLLANNLLQDFPPSIVKLKNLEVIDISNNLFQNFPFFIIELKNLEGVYINGNPFEDNLELASLLKPLSVFESADELAKGTLSFLKYLYELIPSKNINKNKKYFSLQIEKELQTPVLHYILFFKDYVKGAKKKDIHFEVERVGEDILSLVTNGRNEVSTEEMRDYFEEYVDLTRTKMDDWVLKVDSSVSRVEGDILRLKLENEVGRFKNAYKIAQLENDRLKDELDFLRRLSLNFSQKPITLNLKLPEKSDAFNPQKLLMNLRDKAIRLLERKYTKKLEDLHNDEFTDFLRDKGYIISDQSRSGRATLMAGEVDIMVRSENGTPVSIIEAFRLDSCGPNNSIVDSHLDKLLHDYDTVGHPTNFVLVYAEAKNFLKLWENYQAYISELNQKVNFRKEYPLLNFRETGISQKADLKIGLATHERNGQLIEVYHIFVNMYVS